MQTFRFIFFALINQDNDDLLSAHHGVERNEEPVEMEALDSGIEGKSAFYMSTVKEREISR